MKTLAVANAYGYVTLHLSRGRVTIETAEKLVEDLKAAIDRAQIFKRERLKIRPMPGGDKFDARLRVDLRDSYGDTYYTKDSVVKVFRRIAMPGQAESVLKFPFAIGTFWVDAAAFDPL